MSESVQHPGTACPNCGKVLNRARNPLGETVPPAVGDLTICVYCTEIMTFAEQDGKRAFKSIKLEDIKDYKTRMVAADLRDGLREQAGFSE
jgi:hypothetical protein